MPTEPNHWFPAKRYGWGWGVPSRWQGWAVLLAYLALVGLTALLASPEREPFRFIVLLALWTGLLFAVCWVKGERPRWRWGDKG
jgi:hypothetical protein